MDKTGRKVVLVIVVIAVVTAGLYVAATALLGNGGMKCQGIVIDKHGNEKRLCP
jgi:hypothetical protein